jgi:hypothetical protein
MQSEQSVPIKGLFPLYGSSESESLRMIFPEELL